MSFRMAKSIAIGTNAGSVQIFRAMKFFSTKSPILRKENPVLPIISAKDLFNQLGVPKTLYIDGSVKLDKKSSNICCDMKGKILSIPIGLYRNLPRQKITEEEMKAIGKALKEAAMSPKTW